MSVLAKSPDLNKLIEKAVQRIGENHALARDNKGVEMNAKEIEEDRKKFREEKDSMDNVIEESLKAVADEMAEKMVLENTIDGMVKDVIKEKENLKKVNETTTDSIKKVVNKRLKNKLNEDKKAPGYATYEKAIKQSGSETEKYHKDLKKKFEEYNDFNGNTNPQFPHQNDSKTNPDGGYEYYRNTDDDQEFIDDFAYPGLQDFDVHNQNMERLTDYLEGSSETGNAQTDKDDEALGNVVPSKLGEKVLKSKKRRAEKIAKEKASMTNLRGYTPDVQKVSQVKESIETDMDTMKKMWEYNKKTQ
tara:strand:- start:2474 stop:3385 length:912 start_codon:yes stop_codon:yes gene_type:complete